MFNFFFAEHFSCSSSSWSSHHNWLNTLYSPIARYSLVVLKVTLNIKQTNKLWLGLLDFVVAVVEHRHHCLHCTRSWAVVSIVPHVRCASFISCFTPLLHVFWGMPLLLCPCGFHWRTLLVILLLGFFNICPIHVHLLLFSKISADSCFVAFHKSSFFILSDHLIRRIFLRDLFINTWILLTIALVFLQVSKPYSSTCFKFEFNMCILVSHCADARYQYSNSVCLSVCLSVCPSFSGILWKQFKILS